MPEPAVIRIPDTVPLDVASPTGCSITTGFGAVTHDDDIDTGAVVVGSGGVGLSIITAPKVVGVHPIIAVDRSAAKLDTARRLGATHTHKSEPDLAERVRELTSNGADHAFEAIGRVETIESLPRLIAADTAVTVGPPPQVAPVSLDALAESGESFIGSNYGSTVPGREFPHIAELHLMDWFPVDELISHRIPLEGVNGAFDAHGKAIPFFLGEAVTEEANLLTRRPFSLATLLTGHSSHGRLLSLATGPMRPSTPASPALVANLEAIERAR